MDTPDIKKILLVGDHTGETLKRWEQYAVLHGYEIEFKTLEQLCVGYGVSELVIIDSIGLNDMPLPERKPTLMVIDDLMEPISGADIHRAFEVLHTGGRAMGRSYSLKVLAEMHERGEVLNLDFTKLEQRVIDRLKLEEPKPIVEEFQSRRSKGDKHRNRKFRWS